MGLVALIAHPLANSHLGPNMYDIRSERRLVYRPLFGYGGRFPYEKALIGSSFGWLISVSEHRNIYLCNPFLGFTLGDLPPLYVCPNSNCSYCLTKLKDEVFPKAILSADPVADPENPVLVILHSCLRCNTLGVAFLRLHQDSCWTFLKHKNPLEDILIADNKLLAVDNVGRLLAWDFTLLPHQPRTGTGIDRCDGGGGVLFLNYQPESLSSELDLDWDSIFVFNREPPVGIFRGHGLQWNSLPLSFPYFRKHYVVKTYSGSILLAVQFVDESFKVFELDRGQQQWVERTSLGSYALFLGTGQSLAVPVSASYFSGCQQGCIYYTSLQIKSSSWRSSLCDTENDMRIFYLERRCFASYNIRVFHVARCKYAFPIWIVPSIFEPNAINRFMDAFGHRFRSLDSLPSRRL